MYQTALSTSLFKFGLILLLLGSVAACGFKPVYAQTDAATSNKLSSVRVEKIPNRDGQILEFKLVDLLNPQGSPSYASYSLKVNLTYQKAELGISDNLEVTRYDINAIAVYELVSLSDNKVVDSGTVKTKSSYNRTTSEFSTYVAEQDSISLASKELAEQIRARLIYYFDKK